MTDQQNLGIILLLTKIQQAIKLAFLLLGLSNILGLYWYVWCDFFRTNNGFNFIETNGMDELNNYEVAVGLTYFTFTSLSTVGLGDMTP